MEWQQGAAVSGDICTVQHHTSLLCMMALCWAWACQLAWLQGTILIIENVSMGFVALAKALGAASKKTLISK